MMLYFRSLKIVQRDIIVVRVVFLVSTFRHFLVGWFQYPYLNNVDSPLGYVACFLNLSFDVLSVICRFHNLRSPFQILFYLVPPIVFSLQHFQFCRVGLSLGILYLSILFCARSLHIKQLCFKLLTLNCKWIKNC
jgi:hypothetical protein